MPCGVIARIDHTALPEVWGAMGDARNRLSLLEAAQVARPDKRAFLATAQDNLLRTTVKLSYFRDARV